MYNRMEQCYLLLSLAIPPSTSSSLQWSKQSMQKEKRRYGGGEENRGRGRVLFSHPFNNGGMISAYPLISSRLFSPLLRPFCHVSHSATPRCGGRKGSLFLSLASLFLSPLHLFVLPALTQSLSPLQRRDSGAGCDLFFSFPSFFFGISSLFS